MYVSTLSTYVVDVCVRRYCCVICVSLSRPEMSQSSNAGVDLFDLSTQTGKALYHHKDDCSHMSCPFAKHDARLLFFIAFYLFNFKL